MPERKDVRGYGTILLRTASKKRRASVDGESRRRKSAFMALLLRRTRATIGLRRNYAQAQAHSQSRLAVVTAVSVHCSF